MNIWITKISERNFDLREIELLGKCFKKQANIPIGDSYDCLEYKTSFIHYLSFKPQDSHSEKNYNFIHPKKGLTAYSGLLVGKTSSLNDFRSAESISNHSDDPTDFTEKIFGQFSVIKASESRFQCFTDNKSYHNVFYYQQKNGDIYVSNSINFIKLFKEPDFNYDILLDWLALETLLFYETEEKDIYMLPENGVLTWERENGLKVSKYVELTDVLYSTETKENLLLTAVSELQSSAEYLSEYHDCTMNLSGGYDSRLVLSMFWGLDKSRLDALTYADNFFDLSIAKKVARNHSVPHTVLTEFDKLPSVQELHDDLVFERFPFVKYSHVFNYLVKNKLKKIYNSRYRVSMKGYGGNQDRRILENRFLTEYEGEEVIQRFTEYLLKNVYLLREEPKNQLKERILSSYSEKYLSVILERKRQHKFNCILFRERFNAKFHRNAAFMAAPFEDVFLPLLMDSFQKLLFNSDKQELIRSKEQSLYHQMFQNFTKGQDKPIHFTSGLHWEANKLSRGLYRLRKTNTVQSILSSLTNQEKMTTKVKSDFLTQNKSQFFEILRDSESSFLWDYIDREIVLKKFEEVNDYNESDFQVIFQKVIPLLKMDMDNAFEINTFASDILQ